MRDITLADTLFIAFTTRAFATGIPTVLAGSPVVSAYENADLTQITAGITLGLDHDGVVGLNMLTIVATGANGFEAGKDYQLVITTGTVGGVSVVGEVVGQFTIARSAAAVDLANGTDGLGAIKAQTAAIETDTGEIGTAGAGLTESGGTGDQFTAIAVASIANDAITAAAIAANAIGASELATNAIGADQIADGAIGASELATDAIGAAQLAASAITEIGDGVWDTDATARQSAGTFGQAIGDPGANTETMYDAVVTDAAGTNVGADTTAIVADTNELQQDDVPGLIAGLNDITAASVWSVVTRVLTAGTNLEDLSASEVASEVADALRTDTLTATPQGAPSTTPTFMAALMVLYDALVHKVKVDATGKEFNNDGGTVIWKKAVSDDGTDYIEAESASGP